MQLPRLKSLVIKRNQEALLEKDLGIAKQLAEQELIDTSSLHIVINQVRLLQKPILESLLEAHLIDPDKLAWFLEQQLGVACYRSYEIDFSWFQSIKTLLKTGLELRQVQARGFLPISESNHCIQVACQRPYDPSTLEQAEQYFDWHYLIEPVFLMDITIDQLFQALRAQQLGVDALISQIYLPMVSNTQNYLANPETFIIQLVDLMLIEAIDHCASDLHFDSQQSFVIQRLRVDGTLYPKRRLSTSLWVSILVRFKVLAQIDITETILPQDGSFQFQHLSRTYDFRFSSIPSLHGESLVLRITSSESRQQHSSSSQGQRSPHQLLNLHHLNLPKHQNKQLKQLIQQPHGLILIGGPTGSGKTTTLYALLNELDSSKLNIMTLEDPVEHPLTNIRQTTIRPDLGIDFAQGIRTMLRQDPDIMLIGEIRDSESAELAIKASLTGHLVLATVHASFVHDIPNRLNNLLQQHGAFYEQCLALMAQRLIRLICQSCQGRGCKSCLESGYLGRQAIVEITQPEVIDGALILGDYQPISQAARQLLDQGKTDQQEIVRVFG